MCNNYTLVFYVQNGIEKVAKERVGAEDYTVLFHRMFHITLGYLKNMIRTSGILISHLIRTLFETSQLELL